MNKEEIVISIYKNNSIIKYCKAIDYNNWEELRSELINQIYKSELNKLQMAYDNNFLEYLCFTIISRIKKGRIKDTGMFYQRGSVNKNITEGISWDIKDMSLDIEKIYKRVLDQIDLHHWYESTLFKEYYIEGLKLKEIAKKYNINIKSIHYAIQKVKVEIKKQIQNDNNDSIWD
jgi:hypothetical protein